MLDAANGIGERQRERGEIDRFVVEDEHFSCQRPLGSSGR